VEKCELECNEETGKYLALTHAPRRGSMAFLRLLQPTSPGRSSPVAYHAQPIGVTRAGQQQIQKELVWVGCSAAFVVLATLIVQLIRTVAITPVEGR